MNVFSEQPQRPSEGIVVTAGSRASVETIEVLSERTRNLLKNGDSKLGPKRVTASILASAARASLSFDFIFDQMMLPENRGGAFARDAVEKHGRYATKDRLRQLYSRSFLQRGESLRAFRVGSIELLLYLVITAKWPGVSGSSDCKTMLALLHRAWLSGMTEFGADTRTIAEVAGLDRTTVRRALIRLEQRGLVSRTGVNQKGTTQWKLADDIEAQLSGTRSAAMPPVEQYKRYFQVKIDSATGGILAPLGSHVMRNLIVTHPAFRTGYLDQQLWLVLHPENARSSVLLVDITGRGIRHVETMLRRFEQHGLAAESVTGSWIRTGDLDLLDEIAEQRGYAERAKLQRERHEQEREAKNRWSEVELDLPRRSGPFSLSGNESTSTKPTFPEPEPDTREVTAEEIHEQLKGF